MCGICGIINDEPSAPIGREILETMARTMIHRGPDDEGFFFGRGSGLAMRRLSIIDIKGGHQPFSSEDGKVWGVCNGEIYNFSDLKASLESKGHTFFSRADAEIIPHLYEEHGFEFIRRLEGMFAIAVWDETARTLVIARDRMGEKPLYFTHQQGMFIFASELKAILAHPSIQANLNRLALSEYLLHEYVPAPHTIIEGVYKLKPGHFLVLKDSLFTVRPYWDVPTDGENRAISERDAIDEFKRLFISSVRQRLMSDVPLGVFLSGGLDSSSIVAAMSGIMDAPKIRTFTIAFNEKTFDESNHARIVANHFGTDHNEQNCNPLDLIDSFPRIMDFLDEPFGDASIIPTFELARFARTHVKVALGGDGGDELFAGYPTFQAERFTGLYRAVPKFLCRKIIGPAIQKIPVSDEDISFDFKLKQFIKGVEEKYPARHMIWIGSFSPQEQNRLLIAGSLGEALGVTFDHARAAQFASPGNRLLYIYMKTYLEGDVLAKVDRASMGASLEVRAPFLDHNIVEFVARLPYRMKLKGFTLKYLLKEAMAPYLPLGIAHRPKKGFGIPVGSWLKGPLKEMTLDMLDAGKIRREGLFNPGEISRLLKEHFSGRKDNRKKIWTLLMFERWFERWG